MATPLPTCEKRNRGWKRLGDRFGRASNEQSDASERRSRANRQWKVNRRRPVIGDVRPTEMKTLLWNVEWNSSVRKRNFIVDTLRNESPSVFCLTESTDFFVPNFPNTICSQPDYGYAHDGERRKVWLCSDEEWNDVEFGDNGSMPSGRFITGVTHGIRFVGICIPWADAHVTTGTRNRKRWEDHLAFLKSLGPILTSYTNSELPVCVMGDFNQRLPHTKWNSTVISYLRVAFTSGYTLHTEGLTDIDGEYLIDHIATSSQLKYSVDRTFGRNADNGHSVSDHPAIIGTLSTNKMLDRSGDPRVS